MIVIGGCARSGTTLMRRMLDGHPEICCGFESTVFLDWPLDAAKLAFYTKFYSEDETAKWFANSTNRVELIGHLRAADLSRTGKRIWAEKTTWNVSRLDFIWTHFPEARFVHMIRDGRDVVCSMSKFPRFWFSPEKAAERWVEQVNFGRSHANDPRLVEVHYEDLAQSPEETMKKLLNALNVEWSSSVLEVTAVHTSSVGRWRKDLSTDELTVVEPIVRSVLSELGYAL